jgi:two-component system response regulator AtoC
VAIRELGGGPAQESKGASQEAQRLAVLVVDDDDSLLKLFRAILRSADYEVTTAGNGSEALEVATRQHLDVIVMDLRMPVLDGPGFFRELRARGDKTPVLITSAFGARDAQRQLGAEGAIEKPFDPEELLLAVGKLVH